MSNIQLRFKGKHVTVLSGGMVRKLIKGDKENPINNVYEDDIEATLAAAKKRLPNVEFDSVEVADEDKIAAEQKAEFDKLEAEAKEYAESDKGKFEIAFAESESKRKAANLAERKEQFRKTYKAKK